jgi:glycosyltransferase involved in cell wall biosynthesis
MNIWIFQTGEPLHIDKENSRPMRAMNLSNKLVDSGHKVILWSSSFNHQKKIHRSKKYSIHKVNDNLEIRLIPSCGYKKNISFARLFDHFQMAWNLKNLLKKEKNMPDIAFIGYPPIETAFVISGWLKKRKVPVLLDVKDLWPSIFVNAFPKKLKLIAKTLLYPYFYFSKETIRNVDGISTMTKSFLKWTYNYANRSSSKNDIIVRLTSRFQTTEYQKLKEASRWWKELGVDQDRPSVFFVGAFNRNFDFKSVYEAAKTTKNCQFILCGEGPTLNEVKDLMVELPNVFFPGWIDKIKLEALGKMSIACLAPYKNSFDFILSIPNKIVDALSLSLPILSPLKGEVAKLIEENEVGFTYNDDFLLADFINTLIKDMKLQKKMSSNSKKLYELEFEFDMVYDQLVFHLENMVIKKNN